MPDLGVQPALSTTCTDQHSGYVSQCQLFLKGQSNKIFDPQFFSFEPAWATDHWVKIVSFSPRYSKFSIKILRAVWYCAEYNNVILGLQYDEKWTMYLFISRIRIHIYFCITFALKAWAKVWKNSYWLHAVWYCAESSSAQ